MTIRKFFTLTTILFAAFSFVSCSSDDDDASYYVKYEVKNGQAASSVRRTNSWDITYKDVSKEATISNAKNWEGTYGPFKKGDKVFLKTSRHQPHGQPAIRESTRRPGLTSGD